VWKCVILILLMTILMCEILMCVNDNDDMCNMCININNNVCVILILILMY